MPNDNEMKERARKWYFSWRDVRATWAETTIPAEHFEQILVWMAAFALSETEALRKELEPHDVGDGFGSIWPPCEKHHCSMQVVRPGAATCPYCENEDYVDRLIERAESAERERDEALRRVKDLEAAVSWALGEGDSNFRARRDGEGAYWWRNELGKRARGR